MGNADKPHSASQHIEGDSNVQIAGDQYNFQAPERPVRADSLAAVIRTLAESVGPEPPQGRSRIPFRPEDKIAFNGLNRYRAFIEETCLEFHAVEGAYNALAQASYPNARVRLQRHLRSEYRNLRAAEPDLCGDDRIERILSELKALALDCDLSVDDIGWSCDIIVAHAFVECTILEHPSNAG